MFDDTHHSDNTKDRSDDHQQAVEVCEHAVDSLRNGNLAHTQPLLDEARTAIERAQHDDTPTQEYREIAFDRYD